jgi:hypothetical protein
MTAMPMCAEQYAPGSGRTSPTWKSLRSSHPDP